jgi:hypothetical protein
MRRDNVPIRRPRNDAATLSKAVDASVGWLRCTVAVKGCRSRSGSEALIVAASFGCCAVKAWCADGERLGSWSVVALGVRSAAVRGDSAWSVRSALFVNGKIQAQAPMVARRWLRRRRGMGMEMEGSADAGYLDG